MKKIILNVDGMSCSACSNHVEKYLNKQDGIIDAKVNLILNQAEVTYDDKKLNVDKIGKFINDSGYTYAGIFDPKKDLNKKNNNIKSLIIFGILLVIIMYISMSNMFMLPSIPYINMNYPVIYSLFMCIFALVYIIYGIGIIKRGLIDLIHKDPNMDSLVTIGVFASFIYSFMHMIYIFNGNYDYVNSLYFESCMTVIYFVKLGRTIEVSSREHTKDAIKDLVTITPDYALLKTKDSEKKVTIDEVNEGDILICKPGMKVATDGIITKGSAHFDEAFITGESKYYKKSINDEVIAGSLNMDSYIEYKATRIGPKSTISEIVHLVINASNSKTKSERIADKISSIFVPLVMLVAIVTLVIYLFVDKNYALEAFVNVLVVACPCSLGLATPLAVIVSLGASVKRGILVKSCSVFENVNNIDNIIFDKTGTLTYGKLKVAKVYNYSKNKDNELLKLISSLESISTHPIASAFSDYDKYNVTNSETINGMGLKGIINKKTYLVGNNKLLNKYNIKNDHLDDEIKLEKDNNTILYLVEDYKVIGLVGVSDVIRSDAKKTISELKKMDKSVYMLSGDSKILAESVGKKLNIDNIISEVLPKDKEEKISSLQSDNHKVMMVGDGINDAPSLARSDVSVTLGSGTDIASNASDVILINDNLSKIIDLFKIGKKTEKIIKENLFWAFFYNIIMILIATGLFRNYITINPMIASISMMLSSITVILNALRLNKIK